jgi:hypothetical protein
LDINEGRYDEKKVGSLVGSTVASPKTNTKKNINTRK